MEINGFFRRRDVFDDARIFLAINWFFLVGEPGRSFDFDVRRYFIAFWTDCCRWLLLILSFFGRKKFDMPSINCATGRVITVGVVSSSLEFLLRSERVDDVLFRLVFFRADFIVPSWRQLKQAKSPLGMLCSGGSQHFGWIGASQKSQKSN